MSILITCTRSKELEFDINESLFHSYIKPKIDNWNYTGNYGKFILYTFLNIIFSWLHRMLLVTFRKTQMVLWIWKNRHAGNIQTKMNLCFLTLFDARFGFIWFMMTFQCTLWVIVTWNIIVLVLIVILRNIFYI